MKHFCQCELQSITSPWKTISWVEKRSARAGNIVPLVVPGDPRDSHWKVIQMWPYAVDEEFFKKKDPKKK